MNQENDTNKKTSDGIDDPFNDADDDYEEYLNSGTVNTEQAFNDFHQGGGSFKRFVEERKPLPLTIDGESYSINGGSCHEPLVDADLYVSLDTEQPVYLWEQPWNTSQNKIHLRLPIKDMFIPSDVYEFTACVNYAINALKDGKIVHIGCIGGHGRTGMFLAALVQLTMAEELENLEKPISALDYVRDNYSTKAVETIPQLIFLLKEFGIAIPDENQKEFEHFSKIFERDVGVPLKDILHPNVPMEELAHLLDDIENTIYTESLLNRKPIDKSLFLSRPKF